MTTRTEESGVTGVAPVAAVAASAAVIGSAVGDARTESVIEQCNTTKNPLKTSSSMSSAPTLPLSAAKALESNVNGNSTASGGKSASSFEAAKTDMSCAATVPLASNVARDISVDSNVARTSSSLSAVPAEAVTKMPQYHSVVAQSSFETLPVNNDSAPSDPATTSETASINGNAGAVSGVTTSF